MRRAKVALCLNIIPFNNYFYFRLPMRIIILFVLMISVCHFGCADQNQSSANKLAPEAFAQKIAQTPDAYLIDVRTPAEFATGHLANAVNINFNAPDFSQQIARLDKTKPVFVYCAVGGRSGQSVAQFSQLGFTQVIDLQGGINAWKSAGKSVEN